MRLLCFLCALTVAGEAAGDEEERPRAVLAAEVGAAAVIVPLAVGGGVFAGSDDVTVRRAGIYVTLAGLTLAPAVAHLLTREYARAAVFSAVPLAASITTIVILQLAPETLDNGEPLQRTLVPICLSVAALTSVAGLIDVLGADDRWRTRHPLVAAPALVGGGAGLVVGGAF